MPFIFFSDCYIFRCCKAKSKKFLIRICAKSRLFEAAVIECVKVYKYRENSTIFIASKSLLCEKYSIFRGNLVMKKTMNRILSSLLVAVMILTLIPFTGLQLKASAVAKYMWPVLGGYGISRWNSSSHYGVDINSSGNGSSNPQVISTYSGTVTKVSNACSCTGKNVAYYDSNGKYIGMVTCTTHKNNYGNCVIVANDDGTTSVYGHLKYNSIQVSIGSRVSQGQNIGLMGDSGCSTGVHLHFEIRTGSAQSTCIDLKNTSFLPASNIISNSIPGNISISANMYSVGVGDTVTFNYSISGATNRSLGIDWAGGSRYRTIGLSSDSGSVSYTFTEPGLFCCITEGSNSKGYNCCGGVYIRVIDTAPKDISISSDLTSISVGDTVTFKYNITGATYKGIGIDWAGGSRYKSIGLSNDSGTYSVTFTEPGLFCCITEGYNSKGYNCCGGVYIRVIDTVPTNCNISLSETSKKVIPIGSTVTFNYNILGASTKNLGIDYAGGSRYANIPVNRDSGTVSYTFNDSEAHTYCCIIEGFNNIGYNCSPGIYITTFDPNINITFDANGGLCSTTSKTVTYDSSYGTLPTPTRNGYAFEGWFTEAENGTQVKSSDIVSITENQTLYAHWTVLCKHEYSSVITIQPDCTNIGEKTYTCTKCGELYTEEITALGHDYEATVTSPTCTEQGYTTYTCSRCNDSYADSYTEALNHPTKSWHIMKNPTATSTGLMEETCDLCHKRFNEMVIPSSNPNYVTGITLSSDKEIVGVGDSFTLTAVVNPETATNKNVLWSSINSKVATVDNGTVSALKPGSTVIVAQTDDGGYKDFCLIRVVGITPKLNTTAVVDYDNGIISGIAPKLNSLDSFIETSENSLSLAYSTDTIGTGTIVNVCQNGEVVDAYTTVIFGDVNGDGVYDGMDAMIVNCIANGLLTREQVSETVYMAADCNHDGVIDNLDVELLQQAGILLAGVDQTKSEEELLETGSVYAEYLNLIDQSVETETTEVVKETPAEEPANPGFTFNFFDALIAFIKEFIVIIKSALAVIW